MKKVPWDQHSPYALKRDSDHDGISDALDNHVGPGANPPSFLKNTIFDNSPALKPVSWSQHTKHSMDSDLDHDGIPDALDNHVGLGATPPSFLKNTVFDNTSRLKPVCWNQHTPYSL